jgi:hypothetical protein
MARDESVCVRLRKILIESEKLVPTFRTSLDSLVLIFILSSTFTPLQLLYTNTRT